MGKARAIETWCGGILPRAVGFARTLLGSPEDAEDVVQTVLCRLLSHREYDLVRDGEKLLFRSVANACINLTKRRRATTSIEAGGLSELLCDRGAVDPPKAHADRELLDEVGRALHCLSPPMRAAVELRAMGMTLKEVAMALEVTPENAGVLVHRGRKTLRARLGEALPKELR